MSAKFPLPPAEENGLLQKRCPDCGFYEVLPKDAPEWDIRIFKQSPRPSRCQCMVKGDIRDFSFWDYVRPKGSMALRFERVHAIDRVSRRVRVGSRRAEWTPCTQWELLWTIPADKLPDDASKIELADRTPA